MPTIKTLKQIRQEHQLQYKKKKKNPIVKFDISQKIYNSKNWKQLRELYYSEHPLCEQCLEKGIIKAAEEIHHKIPFLTGQTLEEQYHLAYNKDNLQSLCSQCHHEIHNQMRNKEDKQNKELK